MKKFLLLAGLITISACDNLELNDHNIDTSQHANAVKTVTNGSIPTYYQYDGDKVIGITQQGGDGNSVHYSPYTAELSYDGNGRLSQIYYSYPAPGDTFTHAITRYTYNTNGNLQRVKYWRIDTVTSEEILVSSSDYTYDGNAVTGVFQQVEAGTQNKKIYTSENGNVVSVAFYTIDTDHPDGILDHTENYSGFDDKKIAEESLPASLRFPMIFKNNYTVISNGTGTASFEYTYNSDGYPVKRTQNAIFNITYDFARL